MSDDQKQKPGMLSTQQAAALLMVTETYIRQLAAQGVFPKATRGQYALVPLVQGYIKWLRDEDRRSSKSAAQSRVQDARAAEIELRTAERKRQVIPQEDCFAIVSNIVALTREHFDGLPARITRDVTLRATIEQEVDGALTSISKRLELIERGLSEGRSLDETLGQNDAGSMGE